MKRGPSTNAGCSPGGRSRNSFTRFVTLLAVMPLLPATAALSQSVGSSTGPAASITPQNSPASAVRARWLEARLATARLEHANAERGLREALEDQRSIAAVGDAVTNAITMDLAVVVAHQGRFDEADALFRQVAPLIEQTPRLADRAKLATYQAQVTALRGDLNSALAQAGAAVAQWRAIAEPGPEGPRGLDSARAVNRSLASAELAMALNLEASILLRNGDAASAAVRSGEALATLGSAVNAPPWWRADIMATLGEASSQLGRLSAAEQYLKSAARLRKTVFGTGAGTLGVTLALGRAYQAEGMTTNAVLAFRDAMAQASTLPAELTALTDEQLVPFARAVMDLAATLPDDRARQGLYAELFSAFQLARAPDREHVTALTAASLATQSPKLADLLRESVDATNRAARARFELAEAQALAAEERSADRIGQLLAALNEANQKITALQGQLNTEFPSYRGLIQPRIHALDEVRARLAPDEALAMFIIGREQSFLQLVKRDGLTITPIAAGQAALSERVGRLRRGLEIEGRSVNDFDLVAAHELYNTLFGGARQALTGVKRLTVFPTGALSSIPFAVLVDAPVKPLDYGNASWLVKRMAIAHAPGLPSFMTLRSTQVTQPAPRSMLAVANPALKGRQSASSVMATAFAGCRRAGMIDPRVLSALAPLPETQNEVRAVARALGADDADLLLGEGATEPAMRDKRLEDYRVLYFATHGLVPGELQCQNEPGLVLTPPAQAAASRIGDGLLDASEIAALRLRAELVVLSACNTAAPGAGRLGSGSLSGLAEAFFYAGARTVIATHWQVPSSATQRLMQTMFTRIGAGERASVDEGLRLAQLEAIARPEFAHPFFWGAFAVLGDGAGRPSLNGARQ